MSFHRCMGTQAVAHTSHEILFRDETEPTVAHTTEVSLRYALVREARLTGRCVSPTMGQPGNSKMIENRKWVSGCQGLGVGLSTKGHRGILGGKGAVLYLDCVMMLHNCAFAKFHRLVHNKGKFYCR